MAYFTLEEEQIIYQLNGNNIQGDIRQVLKSIEKEKMLELWEEKAKRQATWIKQYPTQIMKQAKRVWKASILKEEGSAWVYYIFAICQWLPTNYRLFSKIPDSLPKTLCLLCQSRKVETVDHMLSCPALASEMNTMRSSLQAVLVSCNFPYAVFPMESPKYKIVQNWIAACSHHVVSDFPRARLELLVWDFFNANNDKQSIGFGQMTKRVLAAIAQVEQKRVDLPKDLIQIFVRELSLWIEGK